MMINAIWRSHPTYDENRHDGFTVRIVTHHPDGSTTHEEILYATKRSAVEVCEKLQRELDDDCEPARTYVLDADMVPIIAGGAPIQSESWRR